MTLRVRVSVMEPTSTAVAEELDLRVEAGLPDVQVRFRLELLEVHVLEVDGLGGVVAVIERRVLRRRAAAVPEAADGRDRVHVASVREIEREVGVGVDQAPRRAGDTQRVLVLEEHERAEGLVLAHQRRNEA
jgi:hypothetical protein